MVTGNGHGVNGFGTQNPVPTPQGRTCFLTYWMSCTTAADSPVHIKLVDLDSKRWSFIQVQRHLELRSLFIHQKEAFYITIQGYPPNLLCLLNQLSNRALFSKSF